MVEGGRLESVWAATSRGFESLLLRQTFSETLLLLGSRFFMLLRPLEIGLSLRRSFVLVVVPRVMEREYCLSRMRDLH